MIGDYIQDEQLLTYLWILRQRWNKTQTAHPMPGCPLQLELKNDSTINRDDLSFITYVLGTYIECHCLSIPLPFLV